MFSIGIGAKKLTIFVNPNATNPPKIERVPHPLPQRQIFPIRRGIFFYYLLSLL